MNESDVVKTVQALVDENAKLKRLLDRVGVYCAGTDGVEHIAQFILDVRAGRKEL